MGRPKKNSQAPIATGQSSIKAYLLPKASNGLKTGFTNASQAQSSAPQQSASMPNQPSSAPSPIVHAPSLQDKSKSKSSHPIPAVGAVMTGLVMIKREGEIGTHAKSSRTVAERCQSIHDDDGFDGYQSKENDEDPGPSYHHLRNPHAPSFMAGPPHPPAQPLEAPNPLVLALQRQLEAIQASLRIDPRSNLTLNDDQRAAAGSSGRMPLLILAGAGTGKTTTLMARTRHQIVHEGVMPQKICLITFTNKAAGEMGHRLSEAMPCIVQAPRGPGDKRRTLVTSTTFHAYCLNILLSHYKGAGYDQRPVVWAYAEVKEAVIISIRRAELDNAAENVKAWMELPSSDWNSILEAVKERHPVLYNEALEHASVVSKKRAEKGKRKAEKESEGGEGVRPKKKARGKGCVATASQPVSSQAGGIAHFLQTAPSSSAPGPSAAGAPPHSKPAQPSKPTQPKQVTTSLFTDMDAESRDAGLQSSSILAPVSNLPPLPPSGNQPPPDAADGREAEIVGQVKLVELLFKLYHLLDKHYNPPRPSNVQQPVQQQQQQQQQGGKKGEMARLKGDKPNLKTIRYYTNWLDIQKRNGRQISDFFGVYNRFYHHYQDLLAKCSAADFNDLLTKVRDMMLSSRDDPRGILSRLRARHTHLLVDEFQDCNPIQIELINLLQEGRHQLTVVGDDAQGIYGFRGASADTFSKFERGFRDADVTFSRPQITANHRSRPKIIRLANHLLTGAGSIPKVLTATKSEGEGVDYDEMAVLFRQFKNMGDKKLEEALVKSGIPYNIIRQVDFLSRVDVVVALSYLRLALNPDDSVAFALVMNKPPRGLPVSVEKALKSIQEDRALQGGSSLLGSSLGRGEETGGSLMAIARSVIDPKNGNKGDLTPRHIKSLSSFINLVEQLGDDVSGMSPSHSISHVLQVTGYAHWLKGTLDKKNKREKDKGDAKAEAEARAGAGAGPSSSAAANKRRQASSSRKLDDEDVEKEGDEEGQGEGEEEDALDEGESDGEDGDAMDEEEKAPDHLASFTHLRHLFYAARGFEREVWSPPAALFSSSSNQGEGEEGPHVDSLLQISAAMASFTPQQMREEAMIPEEVISLIFASQGKGRWCLREFLSHIALLGAGDEAEGIEGKARRRTVGVTISTIHNAKGLEWDTVFVAHYVDGILPQTPRDEEELQVMGMKPAALAARVVDREVQSRLHYEEEKRLAHVAVTRAKERLIITPFRFETRWGNFEGEPRCPSRFSLLTIDPKWSFRSSDAGLDAKSREREAVVRETIEERSSQEDQKRCNSNKRKELL